MALQYLIPANRKRWPTLTYALADASLRVQVLQAQEDAVQSVLQEARDALLQISGNKKQYQALVTDLLVSTGELPGAGTPCNNHN